MKFSDFLIKFAFFLEGSEKYKKTKLFFKNLLENPNYKYNIYFNYFMIFLITSSVAILIEEVTTPISKLLYYYDVYFVTAIFLLEYILRMWVYNDSHKIIIEEFENSAFLEKEFNTKRVIKEIFKKKIEYITSPLAIIDLLAILPSYRELRVLRVFVLFRVFKIIRYSRNINQFFEVLTHKKSELYTLLLLVTFVVLISGISIYVFEEKQNPNISSLFDAFYWSLVTMSTVGFGDITPVTMEGKAITFIIILIGVGMLSFATSIVVSAFSEKINEIKKDRIMHKASNLENLYIICGYSSIADLLANKLKREKEDFIIIDNDEEKVDIATSKGYYAIKADASQEEVFKNIDFDKVKAVLALTNNDMHNIYICLNIRSFNKDVYLVSLSYDKNSYKKLSLAGADYLISIYEITGIFGSRIIDQPYVVEAINDILMARKNAFCEQIEVLEGSFLENKTIGELDIEKYKVVLLGVSRAVEQDILTKKLKREFIFNPDSDFLIAKGDILIIIGYSISISNFKNLVTQSSGKNV